MLTIGLISDTHGLVRPEVFDALAGVDLILHAGDVGPPEVLIELATIAPVRAVWGNTDAPGRPDLVERIDELFEQVRVVVTHGHEIGSPNPPRLVSAYMHADVIVYGHTHQQIITRAATLGPFPTNASMVGASLFFQAITFAAPVLPYPVTDSWRTLYN